MSNRTALQRTAAALVGAAVLGASALVSAPVQAFSLPRAASGAVCLTGGGDAPRSSVVHDTTQVSPAVKAQDAHEVASYLAARRSAVRNARSAATVLPSDITIPVQIHIIRGGHRADRTISTNQARVAFRNMRAAFNGVQDPGMASTGIHFLLQKITVTKNDSWFHASPGSRADKQMKRSLHAGKARMLNVYFNDAKSAGQSLLGIARFPWLAARYPLLDGVTINVRSLRGGSAHGYNDGDTLVHETGHWLGLLHTFEGGCSAGGDYIADTPAEGEPSFRCEYTRDTCKEKPTLTNPVPAISYDPVMNFMDYSYDFCMRRFTPDQRTSMVAHYLRYRAGR